ncbi:MAG: glycosyltransferase family 4 protein [Candidatus Eisenbacteria sp.]|nr:glycosyltransferase family 4 protein [Candidatus Eisenbacteria bacterium]
MRIVVQSIYFPPRAGGIENHVFYLCRELVRRGHEVEVITGRTEPGSPLRETVDGIRVVRQRILGRNVAGWTALALTSLAPLLERSRDADVLHAHTFQSALGPRIAARLFRKPLVVTIHSSHFLRLVQRPGWRWGLGLVLKGADHVLTTSEELAEACRSTHPEVRAQPIVNGVDTELFKPGGGTLQRKGEERILLTTRRLVEKNGVEFLIRAMPMILEQENARLYLIGDGPLRRDLETLARDLGVAEKTVFLGTIPNAQIPGYLSSADVVVIPSLVEATSISALEAMSCEVPVAASRIGGLPEIITEDSGVLFESGNPADLACKVVDFLRADYRREMGRRARERVVAQWGVQRMAEIHEEIYRELIDAKER